jgi:hypothetical protein
VIADPPLLDGTVHVTTADALPALTELTVGADGVPFGVTEVDIADAALPTEFTTSTSNVYAVPLIKPNTIRFVASTAAALVKVGVLAVPA